MTPITKMKSLFSRLLIFLLAANLRAEDPNIRVAFPTQDGFVGVGSGGENIVQVWASKDGRKFDPVQRCKGLLLDAAVVGERLVVATRFEGLYVIALDGSWKLEHTPVKDSLLAIASDGGEVVAVTATKQWRLSAGSQWVEKPFWSSTDGPPKKLVSGKGIWVVAAEGPAEDPNTGGPTRLAWSADGEKWQPARIGKKDAIGIFAVVGNTQGFLAVTATGDGLFSADGKVWQAVKLPGKPLSSELFSTAGKFWLLERADRPPHRLRSSADGKTWATDNLPMEMRAQFLVEQDGQPWIFGFDAENFGVIARADNPHEPASPVAVAVAQAAPPPPVPAAQPVTPVAVAPADPTAATSNQLAAVALALAEFDKAMNAAEPAGYVKPSVTLLKTLRANAGAHPSLPALTDAMRDAIGLIVEASCGLPGYYELVEKVDNKDVQPLMDRLSQEKRDSLRKYAGQVADAYARAQANRTPVPDRSQIVPHTRWPTNPPASRGVQASEVLDLNRVYQRVAGGERGAVADLAIAHWLAMSVPGNGDLTRVWAETYTRLGGTRTLIEKLESGGIKPDDYPPLAQDGSAIVQFLLADLRSGKTRFEEITGADLTLYEKSAAGGYRPASPRLKGIKEARATSPASAPASPPATAATTTPRAAWQMPTKLVIPEKLLAGFEKVFTNAADLAEIGPAAGVLLKNLDGKLEAPVFEAIFNAVVSYVAENAGIAGYMGFSQRLPKPLAAKADRLLPNDKLLKLTGAQFALLGGGQLPDNIKQGWPAGSRTCKASQGRGVMQLDQARGRLLSGDAGGALDLALEYYNGWGVPTDTDLFVFYLDIAARLNPKLKSLPTEPEAKIDALIAGNSAHGRFMRATALLPKDQKIIPPGKARTLLEEAARLGHSVALLQLTISDRAELETN